ncbi:MAG: outer membrane beta-barrel protein [Terriglobales bacterium]
MEIKQSLIVLLPLALFAVAVPLQAQDQPATLEAYGGYSYVRFNVNANVPGFPSSASYNGNGGGQLEYNANRWLGMVGDVAGYGATTTTNGALVGGAFTYLFGPRVNIRRGRVTPFVQTLFGGIATTDGIGHSGYENNLRWHRAAESI